MHFQDILQHPLLSNLDNMWTPDEVLKRLVIQQVLLKYLIGVLEGRFVSIEGTQTFHGYGIECVYPRILCFLVLLQKKTLPHNV